MRTYQSDSQRQRAAPHDPSGDGAESTTVQQLRVRANTDYRRSMCFSFGAAGVFRLGQMTVMIRIASREILSEPLVTLHVLRGQKATSLSIHSIPRWMCSGFPVGAIVSTYQVVSVRLVLAGGRRGREVVLRRRFS